MGLSFLIVTLSVASRSPKPKQSHCPIQDYVLDTFTRTIKLNLHFKFLNQLIFLFSFTVGPRLTEVPERFLVITEEAVASLTCEAFSYPPSVITWTRSLGSLPRKAQQHQKWNFDHSRFLYCRHWDVCLYGQ